MDWVKWRAKLIEQLAYVFGMSIDDASDYVLGTGDECWREMFDDDLTPEDAALEEMNAAASL